MTSISRSDRSDRSGHFLNLSTFVTFVTLRLVRKFAGRLRAAAAAVEQRGERRVSPVSSALCVCSRWNRWNRWNSLEQSETCRMSMSYGFWGVSNPQIGPDNPRQGSGSIKQGKIWTAKRFQPMMPKCELFLAMRTCSQSGLATRDSTIQIWHSFALRWDTE